MSAPRVAWADALRQVQMARLAPGERLRRVRALLDHRYDEPWSVPELAREAHLSREQLIRAFRKGFGITPARYLTARRLDAARALLLEEDLTVTEACMQVGFSSLGSFSAAFRERHGFPPSSLRRPGIVVPAALVRPRPIPTCFLRQVFGRPIS